MDDPKKPGQDNGDKQDDAVSRNNKHIESRLSHIGAKVADADELSEEIIDLEEKQKETLQDVQEEISDLYETLDEEDA